MKPSTTLLRLSNLLSVSSSSFASSLGLGGTDTITQVIYNICDWLSGTPAIGIGILTVIWSGYEMLHGEIDKRKMLIRCIALGLIIGGAYLGTQIIMKGL